VATLDELDPNPQVPGVPSGPQRLIPAINTTTYPLNMPDLGSKGTTFFTSEVILCTSNNENWRDLGGISHPEAFWRRVKFVYAEFNHRAFENDHVHQYPECTKLDIAKELNRRRQIRYCELYKQGKITFDTYIEAAYQYVKLSVKVLTQEDTSVKGGLAMGPCELISTIIAECKSAKRDLASRTGLSQGIIDDYFKGDLLSRIERRARVNRSIQHSDPPEVGLQPDLPSTNKEIDEMLDQLLIQEQGPREALSVFFVAVLTRVSSFFRKEENKKVTAEVKVTRRDDSDGQGELRDKFMDIVKSKCDESNVEFAFLQFPNKDAAMQLLGVDPVLTYDDFLRTGGEGAHKI
jgi:hypothetical protein